MQQQCIRKNKHLCNKQQKEKPVIATRPSTVCSELQLRLPHSKKRLHPSDRELQRQCDCTYGQLQGLPAVLEPQLFQRWKTKSSLDTFPCVILPSGFVLVK